MIVSGLFTFRIFDVKRKAETDLETSDSLEAADVSYLWILLSIWNHISIPVWITYSSAEKEEGINCVNEKKL